MVCTVSATSKQQGKARRVLGSYTQAVDKPVDKFDTVDFGCGLSGGVGGCGYKTFARTLPLKTPRIRKHFIMQKCVFYTVFSIFRWEIFWTLKGQIMRIIYIIPVFLCRKWGYFPKMESFSREKIA